MHSSVFKPCGQPGYSTWYSLCNESMVYSHPQPFVFLMGTKPSGFTQVLQWFTLTLYPQIIQLFNLFSLGLYTVYTGLTTKTTKYI